jgi:hypothetical protein
MDEIINGDPYYTFMGKTQFSPISVMQSLKEDALHTSPPPTLRRSSIGQ